MLTASTATKRKLLLVNTGWCLLLFALFLIGRSNATADRPGFGLGGFLVLFVPSVALLYAQFRGYKQQSRAEKLLTDAMRKLDRERLDYEAQLKAISGHAPVLATVLGGSGSTLKKDSLTLISCRKDCVVFSDPATRTDHVAKFENIVNLEISGPGTEHTNAGMVGGGFGIEGALKGILVASVINQLTAKSRTNTFLRMSTAASETFFHMSTLEPTQLRMILSPAIVKIEASRHSTRTSSSDGLSNEIAKLHNLLQTGAITEDRIFRSQTKAAEVGSLCRE